MTPEQQIVKIIRENKLLDPAEIVDLENLIPMFPQPLTGSNASIRPPKTNLDNARRVEVLTKILNWIKA